MNIAFITFIYPGHRMNEYARKCLYSIKNQKDKNFTLYIFNDGYNELSLILSELNINANVINVTGQVCEIRINAIEYILNKGHDYIIFIDIDDYCDLNRVHIIKDLFRLGADIVVNKLVLFGDQYSEEQDMLSRRITDGEKITCEHIKNGNFMGLSNTAIRGSSIQKSAMFMIKQIAFDWGFYKLALSSGAAAIYTTKTSTYYRQHESNIATLSPKSIDIILNGLKIKIEHLSHFQDPYAINLQNSVERLRHNKILQNKYMDAVISNNENSPMWWENYKTVEEYGL